MDQLLKWLSTWSWGTVPDWLAAIGTVGTLAVALAIIISDRRRNDRTQADGFVTWFMITTHRYTKKPRSWTLDVYAHNTTGAPIVAAFIRSKASVKPNFVKAMNENERAGKTPTWDISAGLQTSISIELEVDPRRLHIIVDFVDAHHRPWHRELFTGKYMSHRAFMRFRRPASPQLLRYRDPADD